MGQKKKSAEKEIYGQSEQERERESDIILMRSALRREIEMQEMSDGAEMTEATKEKKSTRKRRRENKGG